MKYYIRTKHVLEDLENINNLPEQFKVSLNDAINNGGHMKEYLEISVEGLGISVKDLSIDQVPTESIRININNLNSSVLL